MRKFTKEITSLLATVSVGLVMGANTSAAEENIQLAGQMMSSDSFCETDVEEIVPTAGVVAPPDIVTKPENITSSTSTTTTTSTTIPPLGGTTIYRDETSTITSITTTTIPPLAGVIALPDTTTTTTTTTAIPSFIGTTFTTSTTTTTTPTELPPLVGDIAPANGDTNCDGQFDIADAVLIMQALANPNKYGINGTAKNHLTEQGKLNGDMNGDGLTVGDAQAIQRKLLGLDDESSEINSKLSDIVTIKTEYNPAMSDWSGIGILLEFDSPEYDISLEAADGHFLDWEIKEGSGTISNEGKSCDIGKSGYTFWASDNFGYPDGYETEITVNGTSGGRQVELGKIYISQINGMTFAASLEKPKSTASTDSSVIAGKIFAYEKEGAGGYCTLSFNENGRFLYSPGKLSSYMGGGDWKIDGDTVSLIGMVDKTIYLKITDDTLVYIAEGSDEFPYMDIKDGEKFGIYRPEISSDKFQLNSQYSEYGLGDTKVELNLIAGELPEFCYVEDVRLYDENDNFIGIMSPAMDAAIWGYLVDCNVTEECSKTYYTLAKIRCGAKTYLDDVRSEITVNFKDTPAP